MSDVSTVFSNFCSMIKNQFGVNIKRFRSDNAKDYFNQILTPYFQKGIVYESSCINTPQQNGVAERKNGDLLEKIRALLFQKNVSKIFWGEAVLIATHLINHLPSRVLHFKSPMDILSTFYPDLNTTNNLVPRIFGCVSFVHIHSQNRGKLDPKALKCIFVGYSSTQKGYKCYHPPSKKFYVSVDVTFNEQESYFTNPYLQGENSTREDKKDFLLDLSLILMSKTSDPVPAPHLSCSNHVPRSPSEPVPEPMPEPTPRLEPVPETPSEPQKKIDSAHENVRFGKVFTRRKMAAPEPVQVQEFNSDFSNEVIISNHPLQDETESHIDNDDQDLPIAIRKGTRRCTKQPLYPFAHFLSFKNFSPSHRAFLVSLNTIIISTTLSGALSNEKWKQAMNVEMEALEKNKTWELVKLRAGKKSMGSK
uniref:Uncharacterized protein LOC105038855 isoform X1 n=1 Tax=Elaeis guineensis var. tenera TaxID=51953 RepID=A0A6J0PEE7_ELAGV|nr:uncharacterized protein LOC105038855 isoform X1 [Elaeis guineensis]